MRYQVRRVTDDGGELLWAVYDTGSRRVVCQYTRDRLAEIAACRLETAHLRHLEQVAGVRISS